MNFIFFHTNCVDGTMSAAIASLKYPNSKCIKINYGSECFDIIEDHIGKRSITDDYIENIIFVDFGPDTKTLNYLYDKSMFIRIDNITIIDHHKTFAEKIKDSFLYQNEFKQNESKIDFSNKFELISCKDKSEIKNTQFNIIYDKNKCGTTLTYQYLFPNDELPKILEYVEDRDLWLNKLQPNTEYIHIILSSKYLNKPYMVNISKLLELNNKQLNEIIEKGKNVSEYKYNLIANIIENWNNKKSFFNIKEKTYKQKERTIPAINSNLFQSEIGNILLQQDYNICCIYSIDVFNKKVNLSFRSNDKSAKKFAEWFGGGGHDNAAGAIINMKNFNNLIKLKINI